MTNRGAGLQFSVSRPQQTWAIDHGLFAEPAVSRRVTACPGLALKRKAICRLPLARAHRSSPRKLSSEGRRDPAQAARGPRPSAG